MRLHVFYRACDGERMEIRPRFFSKLTCLKNFINALRQVNTAAFYLIYDGKLREDFRVLVEPIGTIEVLPNVGNSASFWYAFQKAVNLPNDHLIYFVEDDYLHCPDALKKLIECIEDVPADYVTLYDHPVRYMPDYPLGGDWPLNENAIYISRSHHWRTVESTCMTFAARAEVLKEDTPIFEIHVHQTRKPADRELFRQLQGLGKYRQDAPLRKLVGPIPSLATHCHVPWLAPMVDWQKIADESR